MLYYGTVMHKHANTRAPPHKTQVKGRRSQHRKHQPCMCTSSNHAPPARRDKEGEQRLERHDGSAIFSLLPSYTKRKKNQSRASSFSRRKVQRNAWSSEKAGGYEIFRLGGKPAASFHFKRLSIRRCHLWRRRRTLERISDGAVMWETGWPAPLMLSPDS